LDEDSIEENWDAIGENGIENLWCWGKKTFKNP
jgi:hypothetical protein